MKTITIDLQSGEVSVRGDLKGKTPDKLVLTIKSIAGKSTRRTRRTGIPKETTPIKKNERRASFMDFTIATPEASLPVTPQAPQKKSRRTKRGKSKTARKTNAKKRKHEDEDFDLEEDDEEPNEDDEEFVVEDDEEEEVYHSESEAEAESSSQEEEPAQNTKRNIFGSNPEIAWHSPQRNALIIEDSEDEPTNNNAPEGPTRRSERIAKNGSGWRDVFMKLKNGDISGFLNDPLIIRTFGAVWVALKDFGQGSTHDQMRELWEAYWHNTVGFGHHTQCKVEKLCMACNKMRVSGCIVYGMKNLRFIGTECYGVKLKPLLDLVDVCFVIAHDRIDTSDFESKVPIMLNEILTTIAEAPIEMKEKYQGGTDILEFSE